VGAAGLRIGAEGVAAIRLLPRPSSVTDRSQGGDWSLESMRRTTGTRRDGVCARGGSMELSARETRVVRGG
jgi:hypothetical protein